MRMIRVMVEMLCDAESLFCRKLDCHLFIVLKMISKFFEVFYSIRTSYNVSDVFYYY